MNLAEDAINRALESESWAREKLAAHAGRTVRLVVGPMSRTSAIDADGRLGPGHAAPDLTLTISPLRLPALVARPERWSALVAALGPIAGQQIADAGRRLLALPEYVAQRFGDSLGRYVADEAQLVVGTEEARAFAAEVATMSARVDALAARIEALEK